MALSEIEKLERRYAENPQGLTFAPLAEVYRKTGDVARALELLRPGLEIHPDYIPASIVLGRCHLDLGDLAAAETAFTHVLGLDGENVIALKALADISERQHHFDQAERWLHTLLSVDRSNDDARAQLERIGVARRDSTSAPPPPSLEEPPSSATAVGEGDVLDGDPVADAETVSGSAAEAPAPEVAEGPAAGERPPAAEPVIPALDERAPVAGWVSAADHEAVPLPLADLEPTYTHDDAAAPPMTGLELDEPAPLAAPVEPLVGLTGRDVDGPADGDFNVELGEDIVLRSSGAHEFQVPDAAAELSHRVPLAPPNPFGEERAPVFGGLDEAPAGAGDDSSPSRWPAMGARTTEPEPAAEASAPEATAAAPAEAAPEPYSPPTAEPVLAGEPPIAATGRGETAWAETERAMPEPAAPPAMEPAEPRGEETPRERPPVVVSEPEPEMVVTETMAQVLLNQGHPVKALEVYRELEVRSSGDPRLRQKIADLEEERRDLPSEAAADAIPADAPPRRQYVAGETGGRTVRDFFQAMLSARPPAAPPAPPVARSAAPATPVQGGAPTRPAADALSLSSVFGEDTAAMPPAVPAGGGSPSAGVSFDDFYSPPGTTGASKSRTSDPKNDDLDQFHAWLQNLKR